MKKSSLSEPIKYKYHRLRPNNKTSVPANFVFFDTETHVIPTRDGGFMYPLRLGCAIYSEFKADLLSHKREVFFFHTPQQFWTWILSHVKSRRKLCLFAHNIFFDLSSTFFYYQAFKAGWTSRIPYAKGMTFIDLISKGPYRIQLLDSGNYFTLPLRAIGKTFGLPKLSVDFQDVSESDLKIYCQRDVEIVEKAITSMVSLVALNDLGHFRMTIPSQAFSTYRHRFMPYSIDIHRKNQPLDLERAAYHGGRSEAFFIGRAGPGPFYKLDVNSMYPSVMYNRQYPSGYAFQKREPTIESVKKLIDRYCLVAECYVTTKKPVFPKLLNGKLCFPVGSFWTVLTSPELEYAFKRGLISEFSVVGIYNKAYLFSGYVKYFYERRMTEKKRGHAASEKMYKLLLNSLYGKWGQKEIDSKVEDEKDKLKVGIEYNYDLESRDVTTITTFGGKRKIDTMKEKDSYNSFTAISAHITAAARMYLWQLIDQAGPKNVYYCDTDSLFVSKTGVERLGDYIDNTELGKLKVEDTTDNLRINTVKDYTFGTEVKLKGVPKSAKKLSKDTYTYQQWHSFRSVFHKKLNSVYRTNKIVKKITKTYDKGQVTESGWVKPFEIHEKLSDWKF